MPQVEQHLRSGHQRRDEEGFIWRRRAHTEQGKFVFLRRSPGVLHVVHWAISFLFAATFVETLLGEEEVGRIHAGVGAGESEACIAAKQLVQESCSRPPKA